MSMPNPPTTPPAGEPAGGNGAPGTNPPAGDDPPPNDADAARQLRNEAKNLRAENKRLADAAAKWTAHQATQQTESEKWATEKASLASETAAAKREAAQLKAAAAAGLPLDMAARLQGDDFDALKADAAELVKMIGPPAPAGAPSSRQRPDPSQGAGQQGGASAGTAVPLNGDPIEAMLREHLGIR